MIHSQRKIAKVTNLIRFVRNNFNINMTSLQISVYVIAINMFIHAHKRAYSMDHLKANTAYSHNNHAS